MSTSPVHMVLKAGGMSTSPIHMVLKAGGMSTSHVHMVLNAGQVTILKSVNVLTVNSICRTSRDFRALYLCE